MKNLKSFSYRGLWLKFEFIAEIYVQCRKLNIPLVNVYRYEENLISTVEHSGAGVEKE